jgi:hypothetical protein
MALPASPEPRLYGFEARLGARVIHGEGALAIMPSPAGYAVVLRAGYAALPVRSGSGSPLELATLDYDGGGAAVSGFAQPGALVRLVIDGGMVGATQTNSSGRFAIVAVDPRRGVAPGSHVIRIEESRGLFVERRVDVSAPTIPADRAYWAVRGPSGWMLSWRGPGGGTQTSLVFDPAAGGVAR